MQPRRPSIWRIYSQLGKCLCIDPAHYWDLSYCWLGSLGMEIRSVSHDPARALSNSADCSSCLPCRFHRRFRLLLLNQLLPDLVFEAVGPRPGPGRLERAGVRHLNYRRSCLLELVPVYKNASKVHPHDLFDCDE